MEHIVDIKDSLIHSCCNFGHVGSGKEPESYVMACSESDDGFCCPDETCVSEILKELKKQSDSQALKILRMQRRVDYFKKTMGELIEEIEAVPIDAHRANYSWAVRRAKEVTDRFNVGE